MNLRRLKRLTGMCLPGSKARAASYPKWQIAVRGGGDPLRSAPGDPEWLLM
jgi:hypothetical protein